MEQINNKLEEKEIKWGGLLNEFLWTCAGVNKKILRQCPIDYAKYAGIGGTILFTALMAMLSGGYALFSVFENQWVAMAFGVFWGLLIFNLDRFIVNTMYSDGKVTISWREFYCGLPRIIMAIFLGIVISTPLELKIFEDAIDIRIEQDKEEMLNKKVEGTIHDRDSISQKRDDVLNGVTMFDSEITTSSTETNNLLSDITSLKSQHNAVELTIANLDKQIAPLRSKLKFMESDNPQRRNIISKIGGLQSKRKSAVNDRNTIAAEIRKKQGAAAASDQNLKDLLANKQSETNKESLRLQGQVDSLNRVIAEAYVRHDNWSKAEIKEKGSFKDKLDVEYKGFQAKMMAFSKLKNDTSTFLSSLFIMLLFIIIETAPTFFKMMIASGPYDDLLRAEMHRVRVLSDKRISDINDNINTEIKISTEKNKNRLEAEVKANQEVLDRIALAQAELLQVAIDAWREEELVKIQANPSNYIRTNMSEQEAGSSAYIRSNMHDDMGNKPNNKPNETEDV